MLYLDWNSILAIKWKWEKAHHAHSACHQGNQLIPYQVFYFSDWGICRWSTVQKTLPVSDNYHKGGWCWIMDFCTADYLLVSKCSCFEGVFWESSDNLRFIISSNTKQYFYFKGYQLWPNCFTYWSFVTMWWLCSRFDMNLKYQKIKNQTKLTWKVRWFDDDFD